ncbi:MAG TPA: FAD-dependent oxidoreductase, partial [Longimicrobiaceae bacterium]|nr:FAD-dependent oxidoreductase [Longimicrobiaceae bacterium]
ASAVAEHEPNLRPGLAGGLRVPSDSVVYPPAVARHLLERARALGAEVREGCRVDAVEPHAVRMGAERLEAQVVVNAAGAEATRLIPALPILPRKGHLLITDRYPGYCRHQIVELGYLKSAHEMGSGESVAFNVQPRATGQLLIGSSRELAGWERAVNREVLRKMLQRAVHFLPGLAGLSTVRSWTGFRPATPDKLPYVGRWEEVPGLWMAAGHEGLGITTSLGTAKLLAGLVVGREPAIEAAPFDPARVLASATEGA